MVDDFTHLFEPPNLATRKAPGSDEQSFDESNIDEENEEQEDIDD